jgi:hypothetical protein
MKIVVDCGNGVAGAIAPELFRRMGCELVELFCEVDGTFPNHHPDPSKPENLKDVIRALQETDAELGLAFDGDGDRLGVVTKDGEIIYPDRQLMLFAADVLTRNPGAQIIYDVKCSRNLARSIRHQGGQPLMWMHRPCPHQGQAEGDRRPARRRDERPHLLQGALVRLRRRPLRRRPPAGNRLALEGRQLAAEAPARCALHAGTQPEDAGRRAARPHRRAAEDGRFEGAQEVITLDGLRVEYADGFGLMRASNTTPVLVLRFEADNAKALARIQADFRRVLRPGAAGPAAGLLRAAISPQVPAGAAVLPWHGHPDPGNLHRPPADPRPRPADCSPTSCCSAAAAELRPGERRQAATATVLSHAFTELGLEAALGPYLGFVNLDARMLMSEVLEMLPRDKFVLEVLETVELTPPVVKRCRALKDMGFTLALDDFVTLEDQHRPLLEMADIVKVELMGMSRRPGRHRQGAAPLAGEAPGGKGGQRGPGQALPELGFELFQGYYFAKPTIIAGKKLSHSELTLNRLLGLILDDADTGELEAIFKPEPGLTLNLMRLTNSAASGVRQKITSVRHAITVLGRRQLQRWLQLLVYADARRATSWPAR